MDAGAVREAAVTLLRDCIAIIEERGKQYGNASLEETGMLTGRSPDDMLLALVEVKLNRQKNDIRASMEAELPIRTKRDTTIDLINYEAFFQGRQDASA